MQNINEKIDMDFSLGKKRKNQFWYINIYTYIVVTIISAIIFNELYESTRELYSDIGAASGWRCLLMVSLLNYVPIVVVGIIVNLIIRKPLRECTALISSIFLIIFYPIIRHIVVVNRWVDEIYIEIGDWPFWQDFYSTSMQISLVMGIMTSYKMLRSNDILGSLFSFGFGKGKNV